MPRTGKRLLAKRKRILKMEMEMELIGTRIAGLKNGLELICKLYEDEENYKLKSAAILVPAGAGQLGLAQWLPYAKIKDGVVISKQDIMYVIEGTDEVTNQYNTAFGSGIVIPTGGPMGGGAPPLKLTT
jgi:hypothetical protein